jgi:hypothetical protein
LNRGKVRHDDKTFVGVQSDRIVFDRSLRQSERSDCDDGDDDDDEEEEEEEERVA